MTIDNLRQQFSSTEWPQFLELQFLENCCSITLNINREIRWFDGHFPAQPILAGVVQTHWAAELGKFLFPLGEDFVRIDNLKFQTVVMPNQQLTLMLEYLPEGNALKFRYVRDELNFSEGKFIFERKQVK